MRLSLIGSALGATALTVVPYAEGAEFAWVMPVNGWPGVATTGGADSGAGTDSSGETDSGGADDEGCGCATSSARAPLSFMVWLLGLVLVGARRPRRGERGR